MYCFTEPGTKSSLIDAIDTDTNITYDLRTKILEIHPLNYVLFHCIVSLYCLSKRFGFENKKKS